MYKHKRIVLVNALLFVIGIFQLNAQIANSALCLDGNDNNPCIGMNIIKKQWTLECWIKGNDRHWKKTEAIIGTGEYGHINTIDKLPLVVRNGHLASIKAHLESSQILDNKWHHVAVSCDGLMTRLFLDGKRVDSSKIASDILPGEIGSSDIDSTTFGGCIDEVRIWNRCLSAGTLANWMDQPITSLHPDFKNLIGYYNFDDMQDNLCLNLVGVGEQSYHLRNTRKAYNGDLPLAYLVPNDNTKFKSNTGNQQLFNAIVINSEWDAEQGGKNDQVLKLRLVTSGASRPLQVSQLNIDLEGTSNLDDISMVHIYYAGQHPRSKTRIELGGRGVKPTRKIAFKLSPEEASTLKEGVNYFLLTFDLKDGASAGDTLRADIKSIVIGQHQYTTRKDMEDNIRKIIVPRSGDANIVKLLQWNIWNGGIHMGKQQGPERIKELIQKTDADIITMEEAYGIQYQMADSLGFHLQTAGKKENLALFSRFPIQTQPSKEHFKSNVAVIELPGNYPVLVANWWLRYAYKHEYTDFYPNTGYDVNDWIKEDKELGYVDARKSLDSDIQPILNRLPALPVIIAGDFNSGSHLDWTARAAKLHYGYGPVKFPISQLMTDEGYTDSYRQIFPNELTHQGGSFAVIYGHLQTSRLDYIYYKGGGLKALYSKIIRTSPEIDDIWPSDHAAVLSVFRYNDQ